ncbi:MAG: alpha/beta hydrolase [Chloroflexaceae bacterium]|nr:alpha/beta hydrolase [Chloroflexaceae bacterium]
MKFIIVSLGRGSRCSIFTGGGVVALLAPHHGNLVDVRTSYALDLPGFGKSPPLSETGGAERMVQLIIDFADAMGLEQFDLNGHSFGGAISVLLATHYPERVRRLILTCYGLLATDFDQYIAESIYINLFPLMKHWHPWVSLLEPAEMLRYAILEQGNLNPLVPWSIALPFFYRVPTDTTMLRLGYNEYITMKQVTSFESMISLGTPRLRASTICIPQPTLLIGGQQDYIVIPGRLRRTAALIPNSRLMWIEECGHVPMIERAEIYADTMRVFLEDPAA